MPLKPESFSAEMQKDFFYNKVHNKDSSRPDPRRDFHQIKAVQLDTDCRPASAEEMLGGVIGSQSVQTNWLDIKDHINSLAVPNKLYLKHHPANIFTFTKSLLSK